MGNFISYGLLPRILNMSLTASVVLLLVLLARLSLRKAPRRFSYALWLVVLFRLLCPVSLSANVSFLGLLDTPVIEATPHTTAVEYIPQDVVHTPNPGVVLPAPGMGEAITGALPQGEEQTVADPLEAPVAIGTWVWLIGAGAMMVSGIISLVRLRRQLVGVVMLEKNVYLADHIETPFVLGVIRPKIYLPSALPEQERGYILLHERCHIRRLDPVVKLLAFLALCIHWFNPLAWLFFVLLSRDMEMSCDEAVMKKLGANVRADYSASLLRLATGRKIISGAPLAFGEGDTRERVKHVLRWKKPQVWLLVFSAAVVIVVAVICGTNASNKSMVQTRRIENGAEVALTLREPIRSYAVYEEIYQDGCLISGKPIICNSFQDDDWGSMPYRGTFTLSMELSALPDGGFSGELTTWYEENSVVSQKTTLLPRPAYTRMDGVVGTGNQEGTLSSETNSLEAGEDIILYSIVLTNAPDGEVCIYHNGWSLAKANDTVVQYRLVTSENPAETYTDLPLDLAQTLYDLRVETLNDQDDPGAQTAIRTLLDAMGASAYGTYELQYYDLSKEPQFPAARHAGEYWPGGRASAPPYRKTALVIWYDAPLEEEGASEFYAGQRGIPDLMLALVPELSEVYIGCAGPDGTAGYTGSSDKEDYIRTYLGYESFDAVGRSAAGIRALMGLLEWPEGLGEGQNRPVTLPLTAAEPCAPTEAGGGEIPEVTTADIAETLASCALPDGTTVLFYSSVSGDKYCAYIPAGTQRLIRFIQEENAYTYGYDISLYENVLGHSGFSIECPRGAAYDANDYYYFDEDGTLWMLADCGSAALEIDLDRDGQKELLWSYHGRELYYYTQMDGRLYLADLCALTAEALGYRQGDGIQIALAVPERAEDFADGVTSCTILLFEEESGTPTGQLSGTIHLTPRELEVVPNQASNVIY